jgi:hypothetical protein
MLKLRESKKGSIIDIAFVLVAILGLAILLVIAGYIYPRITGQIKATEGIGNDSSAVAALNYTESLTTRYDSLFLMIFIGLSISVLITSFLIDSSPIFIPIYIIALGLLIIFAVVVENVYDKFLTDATLGATALSHPITLYILTHLVMVTIGLGVLSMILIFGKSSISGGNRL